MDGFSILDGSWREPLDSHREYDIGNALGWLYRTHGKQAATNHALVGRLYLAKSGWLLLSVPNALVRGIYDAMSAPGAELPLAGVFNVPNVDADVLNAHISVMTADEVKKVGYDNINERGHMFGYSLGGLKEITPNNVDGVSKVWAIQVSSPALSALRKSYGLSALPNGHPFHITVAARRKKVLQENSVRKAASELSRSGSKLSRSGQNDLLPGGKADNLPDREISPVALAEGAEHEHEHTNNDQVAKEIAKDHLSEDPRYYKKVKIIEESKSASSEQIKMPPKPAGVPKQDTAPPEMPPPVTTDVSFGVVPPPSLPPSGQQLPNPQQQDDEEQKKMAATVTRIIDELRAAKDHSDNKRYDQKHAIIRRLMENAPKDWEVDDPKPYHKGVTHKPTSFKFHVAPTAIPTYVKAAYRQPRGAYATALYNSFGLHRPITYDYNKTVAENVQNQLTQVKQRGDFMLQAKRNHQRYMATLDPNYRYELAMKAMNNELEEPPLADQLIERHGDSILNTVFGRPK
jgi:hypothetical protein